MRPCIQIQGCLMLMLGLCLNVSAQDNHYAWIQFGSRNSLLNNANLSHFEDESAGIINPATLSKATRSSFNFNTNAISFNQINFEDGLGNGFTINNSNLTVLPSTASGVIKPKNSKRELAVGYSLFTSNRDLLNFSDGVQADLDVINEAESPGNEYYLAQYNLRNILAELSAVIGIGWIVSPKLSLGISQSFCYRTHEYSEIFTAYAIPDPTTGTTLDLVGTNSIYFAHYYKIMTYTKVGLTSRLNHWDIGFVITSPTIGILGRGKILADYSLTNVRLSEDPTLDRKSYIANGEFSKLQSTYKYPVNASLGISRRFGKVSLFGGASWHGHIDPYSILDPGDAPFIQPPNEDNVLYTSQFLRFWSSNRTVINGSFAADWMVAPDNHLLFSVRTDFHYGDFGYDEAGINSAIKQWDNYHFTLGTQRTFGSSQWVVGVRYSYARSNDYPQPISYTDPTEDNFFQGDPDTGTLTSNGLQFMLSYTFIFGGEEKTPNQ